MPDGQTQVVWIDASLPMRVGLHLRGKDGKRWLVTAVYCQTLEPHLLNRGWSVGGLL